MSTYADLINETLSYLSSFGRDRDKVTTLTGSLTNSATTFTVADGNQVDRGFVEIDDELMAVNTVSGNTVTLHPWGRGANGTSAVSHSSNAMVVCSPAFPRSRVKQEIQQSVNSLYPMLFDTATYETTMVPTTVCYSVPAAVESVVSVSYQTIGPSQMWAPVSRWRLDYNADLTLFPTGRTLDIYAGMAPGRTIKIVYRKKLGTFTSESDTLTSVGVREEWRDIVRLLAVGRLVMGLDPARLSLDTVEADNRAVYVQPLNAANVGRSFMAAAQQRIAEERRQLLVEFPTSQVRVN